jgi:GTPase Era involved in 16S rRNA processing
MVRAAERTLKDSDVILWLVEPTTFIGAGEQHIAELIRDMEQPKLLIINKSDSVKSEDLLPCIEKYSQVCEFDEIIPASALTGANTDVVLDMIFKYRSNIQISHPGRLETDNWDSIRILFEYPDIQQVNVWTSALYSPTSAHMRTCAFILNMSNHSLNVPQMLKNAKI